MLSQWMLALGLGMGLTCVLLSLRYRAPVVTAWSTPGAALLVTSAAGLTIEEATGAFLVVLVMASMPAVRRPRGAHPVPRRSRALPR